MSKFYGYTEMFFLSRSEGTKQTYTRIFKEYIDFIGSDDTIFNPKLEDVFKYIGYLKGKRGKVSKLDAKDEFSWVTIERNINALRAFYSYLQELGAVTLNPFDHEQFRFKKKTKNQKRPIKAFPPERVPDIMKLPEKFAKEGVRDSAILACIFYGALREGEVIKIKIRDLRKTASGTLFILLRETKSGEDRSQPISWEGAQYIQRMYEQRIIEGAREDDPFIVSYRGMPRKAGKRHIGRRAIYDCFRHYSGLLGITDCSPHSGRSTGIIKLLQGGMPHREVKEFSRHASVSMVELYDKREFAIEDHPGKLLSYKKVI